MISDLDNSIRTFLIKEGGFNPSEIDISFDIPNQEWSARLSRPTLNCYLFDVRQNRQMRTEGERLTRRGTERVWSKPPLLYDLTYLLTAWTQSAEDEHRLLWHALQIFVRFNTLPAAHLQGALRDLASPVAINVGEPEGVLRSPGEFWSALGNQLKPSLSCLTTLPVERSATIAGGPVLTTILRTGRYQGSADEDEPGTVDEPIEDMIWIAGTIRNAAGEPLQGAAVGVEGRAQRVQSDGAGRFRLQVPSPGTHTLVAQTGDHSERLTVEVTAPHYDITVPSVDR